MFFRRPMGKSRYKAELFDKSLNFIMPAGGPLSRVRWHVPISGQVPIGIGMSCHDKIVRMESKKQGTRESIN
jgi:hypothetical protein